MSSNTPVPKRLKGRCPMELDLKQYKSKFLMPRPCEGDKCRFIKKGCLYSRMKTESRLTQRVLNRLNWEGVKFA